MTEGMELVYYNSWDQSCKQPFGASQAGRQLILPYIERIQVFGRFIYKYIKIMVPMKK